MGESEHPHNGCQADNRDEPLAVFGKYVSEAEVDNQRQGDCKQPANMGTQARQQSLFYRFGKAFGVYVSSIKNRARREWWIDRREDNPSVLILLLLTRSSPC